MVVVGARALNGLLSLLVRTLLGNPSAAAWALANPQLFYLGEALLFGASGLMFVALATLVAPTARKRTAVALLLVELFVTWALLRAPADELAAISRGYMVGAILGAVAAVLLVRRREARMFRTTIREVPA